MLREIYYHLLAYRSIMAPFLVVSAIAVPCWVLFRFFLRRALEQPPSFRREALLVVLVLYLSGVAAATLAPNHNPRLLVEEAKGIELKPDLLALTCSPAFLPSGTIMPGFCTYNAKGNILLFIPFGILIPFIWTRRSFWKEIQIAIALSLTIETIQYLSRPFGSHRAADINDVILNVLGASLGLALAHALRALVRRGHIPAPLAGES